MGETTTTYCPYCKKEINNFESSFKNSKYSTYIGKKFEICPNCQKVFATGKKLYYEMNEEEKNSVHKCYNMKRLFLILAFFGILIALVAIVAAMTNNINNIVLGALVIIPISIILGCIVAKKEYNNIKIIDYNSFTYANSEMKEMEINYTVVDGKIKKKFMQ